MSGHDKCNRPILVTQPKVMFDANPTAQEVITAMGFALTFVKEHLLRDGKCENFIIIQDLSGLGVFNIGYKLLGAVIKFISQISRGRSRNVFILNAPMTFSGIFKLAKPFLDDATKAKIEVSRHKTTEAMQALIDPDQLEKRIGGTRPNKKPGEFWPPEVPSFAE